MFFFSRIGAGNDFLLEPSSIFAGTSDMFCCYGWNFLLELVFPLLESVTSVNFAGTNMLFCWNQRCVLLLPTVIFAGTGVVFARTGVVFAATGVDFCWHRCFLLLESANGRRPGAVDVATGDRLWRGR